jgi:hypothetical protein
MVEETPAARTSHPDVVQRLHETVGPATGVAPWETPRGSIAKSRVLRTSLCARPRLPPPAPINAVMMAP